MSALIKRCENFGHFWNFCSQLVQAAERQTKALLVGRYVNFLETTALNVSRLYLSNYEGFPDPY